MMDNSPIKYASSHEVPRRTTSSLRDGIITIYRRKWIVLAIALPIIVAGGIALLNQTGAYWATARVLVKLANVDQPRWNAAGRNVDYDRELSTLFNIAMSAPVGELAAVSLEDSIPLIRSLAPPLAGLEGKEDLTGFLLGSTNVTVLGESRILEFQVNAPHPRLALMGAGAMRDAFIDFLVTGQKNNQAVAYYQEQIAIVQAQVDSLLSRRATILEESGYTDIFDQMKTEAGSMADGQYKLMEARSAFQALDIRYRALIAALEKDPREFPMGVDESHTYTLVQLHELVVNHEDNLNALKTVNTSTSIPVRQQEELLADALVNLRREQIAYVESIRIALDALRVKENLLADLVDGYNVRRKNAPQASYRISSLEADIYSLRDVVGNLQIKLGEVRISDQADNRVSSVVPLTLPSLSEVTSRGKSAIYFGILALFALALGVIAVFVLESLDHRISSPAEITEYLQLPVFASIRKTN